MSDYGDMCRELRDLKRDARRKHGVPCPMCQKLRPKADATILLPQQRCKMHDYRDPRPRTTDVEYMHRVSREVDKGTP